MTTTRKYLGPQAFSVNMTSTPVISLDIESVAHAVCDIDGHSHGHEKLRLQLDGALLLLDMHERLDVAHVYHGCPVETIYVELDKLGTKAVLASHLFDPPGRDYFSHSTLPAGAETAKRSMYWLDVYDRDMMHALDRCGNDGGDAGGDDGSGQGGVPPTLPFLLEPDDNSWRTVYESVAFVVVVRMMPLFASLCTTYIAVRPESGARVPPPAAATAAVTHHPDG